MPHLIVRTPWLSPETRVSSPYPLYGICTPALVYGMKRQGRFFTPEVRSGGRAEDPGRDAALPLSMGGYQVPGLGSPPPKKTMIARRKFPARPSWPFQAIRLFKLVSRGASPSPSNPPHIPQNYWFQSLSLAGYPAKGQGGVSRFLKTSPNSERKMASSPRQRVASSSGDSSTNPC